MAVCSQGTSLLVVNHILNNTQLKVNSQILGTFSKRSYRVFNRVKGKKNNSSSLKETIGIGLCSGEEISVQSRGVHSKRGMSPFFLTGSQSATILANEIAIATLC